MYKVTRMRTLEQFLQEFDGKILPFDLDIQELKYVIHKYDLRRLNERAFRSTLFEFVPDLYFDHWKPYQVPEEFGWTDEYQRAVFDGELEIDRIFHDSIQNVYNICEASIAVNLTKGTKEMDERERIIRSIDYQANTRLYFFAPSSNINKLIHDKRLLSFIRRKNSKLILTSFTKKEFHDFCNIQYRLSFINESSKSSKPKYNNRSSLKTYSTSR